MAIKRLFSTGPTATVRLIVLIIISLILITLDHKRNTFEFLRSSLNIGVYPIQQIVHIPSAATDYLSENLVSRGTFIDRIKELQRKNTLNNARLLKLESLEHENIRLRALLDSSFEVGERVSIAEIIRVDMDPYKHHVLINKGSWDNVFRLQPILNANGVLGQVVHTSPKTSQVILISDPDHAIPVQLNRSGFRSIALGTGTTGRLELPYIPNNTDIKIGDLLITSGLGGRFPSGYPVAKVTEIITNPGKPFATVSAEPTAKLDQIKEILLVWRGGPEKNSPQFNYDYQNSTNQTDNGKPDKNQDGKQGGGNK